MDLTQTYPRSVREKWLGIVQLGRALDKGKAKAHGNLGEYNYDCPMDQAVFDFLGMNGEEFLTVIKNAKSDAEIEAYARPFVEKKSAQESRAVESGMAEPRPLGREPGVLHEPAGHRGAGTHGRDDLGRRSRLRREARGSHPPDGAGLTATIRAVVQYDGTNFCGMQFQPRERTVAGELERVFGKLLGHEVKITSAGRTDSGVHASGQVVSFKTQTAFPFDRLPIAANSELPRDVSIREASVVAEDFSARFSAIERRLRVRGPCRKTA